MTSEYVTGLPFEGRVRRANCWVNAPTESFFDKLKSEWVHGQDYATRHEARLHVFEYLELFYNRNCKHAALGYLTPAAFENRYLHNQTQAA